MNINRMNKQLLMACLAIAVLSTACKKDKDDPVTPTPTPVNEEELITTLLLNFIDANNDTTQFSFVDLDGDGGNDPVVTEDTLDAMTSYTLNLQFLNESETPVEDITMEVVDEGVDHQVFFDKRGLDLDIDYNDQDDNGDPIGVENMCMTNLASMDTLVITLRHEPDKGAAGVSSGDITNAGGETDIEVKFFTVVQ